MRLLMLITLLFPVLLKASIVTTIPTYKFNEFQLRQEHIMHLNRMIETLMENPGLVIQIRGQRHWKEEKKDIGLLRAKTARNYLISKGIKPRRLEVSSISYKDEYYMYQLVQYAFNNDLPISFHNKKSLLTNLFNSDFALQLEYKVIATNFPKTKGTKKAVKDSSHFLPQVVYGLCLDKFSKKPLKNSKFMISGRDGSSSEILSQTGLYFFNLEDHTTYQIQADNDLGDTICDFTRKRYFASEKALVSTICDTCFNNPFLQILELEEIMVCGAYTLPFLKEIEGYLHTQNKIRLNVLVEIMLDNPTLEISVNHYKLPKSAKLICGYLVSKGIDERRLSIKSSLTLKLDCLFVGNNKRDYPDLNENITLTEEGIHHLSEKTKSLLKDKIGHNIGFEIIGTNFKP